MVRQTLIHALVAALNKSKFRWRMTPHLAYGRHRGPARVDSRQAAVAVCIFPGGDEKWHVVLTRRPITLRHHGGQICFPGGRIEAAETPEQASLREFEEEIGVSAKVDTVCGFLPQQYVYASDNLVTPVVFVLKEQPHPIAPDPVEVDEVIFWPLTASTNEPQIEPTRQVRPIKTAKANARTSVERYALEFTAPAFRWDSYQVWGATAVILDQLAQCLQNP